MSIKIRIQTKENKESLEDIDIDIGSEEKCSCSGSGTIPNEKIVENNSGDKQRRFEIFQKYSDDQHTLIIKNAEAQEKLIIKISTIVIGAMFTYSKFLQETPINYQTKWSLYLFMSTIILAVISYSLGQYINEKVITYAREHIIDEKPWVDVSKLPSEIIRKILDYAISLIFIVALVLALRGSLAQYDDYLSKAKSKSKIEIKTNLQGEINVKTK